MAADALAADARACAREWAGGLSLANDITKTMLPQEWNIGTDHAIRAQAQAHAQCMTGDDFRRACAAFVAERKPSFEANL